MVYEKFLTTVTQKLQEQLGTDYQLALHPLKKNNGVTLDGLSILAPGESAAPTVYLNAYYTQYQRGMKLDDILSDIIHLIRSTPVPVCPTAEELRSLDALRPKIMFKLIHAASNESLLSDIPHLPHLDLAIVFYLFLGRNQNGQMTALIHNEHLRNWNISVHELWQIARKNTEREFPAELHSMSDIMKAIAAENLGSQYDESLLDEMLADEDVLPLFVLTNSVGVNGAACILYPDTLKNFADCLDEDLIILPSSIHEVLITPDTAEASYEELHDLVTSINQQEVPVEDQLSNQIYLYTRSDHRLHLAVSGSDHIDSATFHTS